MWDRGLEPHHASAGCARRLSTCEDELLGCLMEASQGPSGSAYNGPYSHTLLTLLHTMFQVPTLLPFPTNVPFSSTRALPAFQLLLIKPSTNAIFSRKPFWTTLPSERVLPLSPEAPASWPDSWPLWTALFFTESAAPQG